MAAINQLGGMPGQSEQGVPQKKPETTKTAFQESILYLKFCLKTAKLVGNYLTVYYIDLD